MKRPDKDPHVAALGQAVATLLQCTQATSNYIGPPGKAYQQSPLDPKGINLMAVVLENQSHIMRSLAFLMDEIRAMRGYGRVIRLMENKNGNRRPNPLRVV